MKLLAITIFFLSIFLSCTSPSPTKKDSADKTQSKENNDAEENALRRIFSKIKKSSRTSFTGKKILIGDSTITLKIVTEFDGQKAGQWIHAAAFTTSYDFGKKEQITVGSVGLGADTNEAQEICTQEWFAAFGIAFINMLQDSSGLVVASNKAFPGYMGIRGNLPANTWLKGDEKMYRTIMSKLDSRVSHAAGTLIPIDIKLMIENGKITSGECRLNNLVSSELLSDLKQLDWPSSNEGFLFKQFYLAKKLAD